jgi:hypothetical protein
MSGTKGALTDIAAVGETRAECLREAGYSTISDVANASAAQIADVPMISLNTSRGLRHAAKELRGDPDTIQRKIATECDAPREEVAEAFAKLAYLGSPYSEKKRALREKFSDPDRESILWLERRSLARRFLLWEAGYCTIESVAN